MKALKAMFTDHWVHYDERGYLVIEEIFRKDEAIITIGILGFTFTCGVAAILMGIL